INVKFGLPTPDKQLNSQLAQQVISKCGGDRRGVSLLLEQLRPAHGAGEDGGVCPPAALGGAVSRGSEGVAGLGPVPGAAVVGLPPARGERDAGVQLSGLARVPAAAADAAKGPATPAFFPLGRIAGGCRCRRSTVASATGCGVRRHESSWTERALLGFAPCGIDLSRGSHKAVLTRP